MPAILHQYIPQRVIDSNGIADGSVLSFFESGTLTPAPIYTDDTLATEMENPVIVPAGAEVPAIYLDSAIAYRRYITFPGGGQPDDKDPWTGLDADGILFGGATLGQNLAALPDVISKTATIIAARNFRTLLTGKVEPAGFADMAEAIREAGSARLVCDPAVPIEASHGFEIGGFRNLTIEGNGVTWINGLPTVDPLPRHIGNYYCFHSPVAMFPNGHYPLLFGNTVEGGDQSASYDVGTRIESVGAGASTITSLGGALATGWHLIYGLDRYNSPPLEPGFPPAARYFEPVFITVAGTTATLRSPLRYSYDDNWPDVQDNAVGVWGAARIIPLGRADGNGRRAYTYPNSLIISDVNFAANPASTGPLAAASGVVLIGGAKYVETNRCYFPVLNNTMCDLHVDNDSYVAGKFEIDKLIGATVLNRTNVAQLDGATGCHNVTLNNITVRDRLGVAPNVSLVVNGGDNLGRAIGWDLACITPYFGFGSERIIVDGMRFHANHPEQDRLTGRYYGKADFDVVSQTEIVLPRATFDSEPPATTNPIAQALREDMFLFRQYGEPAFRVDRFDCGGGNRQAGDIHLHGEALSGDVVDGEELFWSHTPFMDLKPVYVGPYRNQISFLSNEVIASPGPFYGRVLVDEPGLKITNNMIEITDRYTAFPRASNAHSLTLGRRVRVHKVLIDVRTATSLTGPLYLRLSGTDDSGATVHLWSAANLLQTGVRLGDHAGQIRLTGDVPNSPAGGSADFVLPPDCICFFGLVDESAATLVGPTWAANAGEERARWRIQLMITPE